MKGRGAERPSPPCSLWPLQCLKLNLAECGQSICVWVFFFFYYVFSYLWLFWVFITAHGLFLVSVSGVFSSLWCTGFFSLRHLLLLRNTGSRSRWLSDQGVWAYSSGSVVVAHRLNHSAACWHPPGPGIDPAALALQGELPTIGPQGKPSRFFNNK